MNPKTKYRIWVGGAMFTMLMMAFGTNGSFNPKDITFWLAIGSEALWAGMMLYFFGKYQKDDF